MTIDILFSEIPNELPDLLNNLSMSLVEHAKEYFDLVPVQLLVLPEHGRAYIVDKVDYALVYLIKTD